MKEGEAITKTTLKYSSVKKITICEVRLSHARLDTRERKVRSTKKRSELLKEKTETKTIMHKIFSLV